MDLFRNWWRERAEEAERTKEEGRDAGDAGAYQAARDADRVVVDTDRIIGYAKGLEVMARQVRAHIDGLRAVDDWVLHNGMVPNAPGLLRVAEQRLRAAETTLKDAQRKTHGLAVTYQAVDSRYPGTGVPQWLWQDTLNPRADGGKKQGAKFYDDLDDVYAAAVRATDTRGTLRKGLNRAGNAMLAYDTLDGLRKVLGYQQAANELVRAASITALNDALAQKSLRGGARTKRLMSWLGIDNASAASIAKAFEDGGEFSSIDDLIVRSHMPNETRFWIYDSVTGGRLAPQLQLQWGRITARLGAGKLDDAAGLARASKAYQAMSAQMDRQWVKATRKRVGSFVPYAGAALDAEAVVNPRSSRLAKTSGALGMAAFGAENAAIAATASVWGAPADAALVPAAVVLEAASIGVGVADIAWSYRSNQIKRAEYKKTFEVSYSHYTQRFLDERIQRLKVEHQNKEECRTDVITSYRRPVEARAMAG